MAHKHAPRGPIKSKDHKDGSDHTDVPRCTATAKGSGQRCKRRPIPGGTVCVKHGGGAPQVKLKAQERLRQLVDPALEGYAWLLQQREYPSALLSTARDVLDREFGKPAESVAIEHSGGLKIQHELPE